MQLCCAVRCVVMCKEAVIEKKADAWLHPRVENSRRLEITHVMRPIKACQATVEPIIAWARPAHLCATHCIPLFIGTGIADTTRCVRGDDLAASLTNSLRSAVLQAALHEHRFATSVRTKPNPLGIAETSALHDLSDQRSGQVRRRALCCNCACQARQAASHLQSRASAHCSEGEIRCRQALQR